MDFSAARGPRALRRPARHKPTIPREFIPLLNRFALDAHHRIELWCYALVLLMIDEEQVRVSGVRELAGRDWIVLQIYGGEEFEIVKPNLQEDQEQSLLEGVRDIVERARARRKRLN